MGALLRENPSGVVHQIKVFLRVLHFAEFCFINAGKTQDELLAVWLQEAKAALGGKKSGKVVDLWKVVGERKVSKVFTQLHTS